MKEIGLSQQWLWSVVSPKKGCENSGLWNGGRGGDRVDKVGPFYFFAIPPVLFWLTCHLDPGSFSQKWYKSASQNRLLDKVKVTFKFVGNPGHNIPIFSILC